MTGISTLFTNLNTRWHAVALWGFVAMVLAHLAEHAVQAVQIFVLGWDRPDSRGLVGQWMPWLVTSETMHYLYAIFTLLGIVVLLPAFLGQARFWWFTALLTQFWHHFEHVLLLYQQLTHPFFGEAVPTSIVQLWFARVELHVFYNTIVFIPLLIAMWYHLRPEPGEMPLCTCARWPFRRATVTARAR